MGMRFRVTVNNIPRILDSMRAGASRVVRESAFELEGDIKQQMAEHKSGRIYGQHQASAPGEAPAMDSGVYAGSITTDAEPGSLEATVYTPMDYGPHLEYGTVSMEPRPHFTPAAERMRDPFVDRMRRMMNGLR